MINERIALVLLNGEAGTLKNDPHYRREFYHCMETFATASVAVCQSGNLRKFESHLKVARKLYSEGNETVKNGIINVFLFKALDTIDQFPSARQIADQCLPGELLKEINRLHYSSGL